MTHSPNSSSSSITFDIHGCYQIGCRRRRRRLAVGDSYALITLRTLTYDIALPDEIFPTTTKSTYNFFLLMGII
jgi:hypothetical protein